MANRALGAAQASSSSAAGASLHPTRSAPLACRTDEPSISHREQHCMVPPCTIAAAPAHCLTSERCNSPIERSHRHTRSARVLPGSIGVHSSAACSCEMHHTPLLARHCLVLHHMRGATSCRRECTPGLALLLRAFATHGARACTATHVANTAAR